MSNSQEQENNQNESFPVVGIGASAGGLEAFEELLSHLPDDTGMAFVIIQHLAADRESLLTEILARATQLPCTSVQGNTLLEPNCIYVIPPNRKMTLADGELQLSPRENIRGRHMPVDAFFASLAAGRGTKAIAVVLSGTDGDGASGIEEVKAAGGITFAQCEATAQFDGMPNTAAATGQVDFILPPSAIAQEIVKISQHPYLLRQSTPESEQPSSEESALSEIFLLLRNATGVNFANYKRSTVQRRIGRRMALYKQNRLADYLSYLQDHPDEVQALYRDLLIVVTQFFRDEHAFAALKERVLPQIVSGKSFDSAIRIWVAGCATGEEVYSLAICLLQYLAEQPTKPKIQIFGTDLSETAIEKARQGIYQENQVAGLSSELLRRFFIQVEKGYRISQRIREMCIFAKHNLCSDPPFSSLDLISCRNVLIYFAPSLQKRVLPLLHYSLKPTGFLLLGASESVGNASDLFVTVDDKSRIYARTQAPSRHSFEPTFGNSLSATANNEEESDRQEQNNVSIQQQAERIILDRYTPIGVLCTQRLDILQFRGDTSAYLRPAPGEPSFNLLKMAQPSLLPELRAAIHQAQTQNSSVSKQVLFADDPRSAVEIDLIPVPATSTPETYWLVLFKPSTTSVVESEEEGNRGDGEGQTSKILRLREELADSQAYLQASLEEQEATNQRLAAANEEILSNNEELQSTNEELQTTKEEVQSANEELKTTNEELQSRNLEARQSNDDLLNLLNSIEIPILMLEKDFRIRRFTATAQRIFNLIPTDVGRPVSDIRLNLDLPDLESAIAEAIDTPTIIRREVRDKSLHWYELCIRPYKTADDRIDGAVVSLIDIDDLKRNAEQIEASRDYAEAANVSKDEFISLVSHELRTPLNSIIGWSQILLNRNPDEETTTRALKTIVNSARLQSQLIEDLLDISRIVRGELRLESDPFSLTSVIEAAIETVRPAAEQKGIQLQSSLAECPAKVSGDSTRMQQVIWNLLTNAIKFTPENGRVEISLSCDSDHAQVRITDTGKGISADFLPHIFDRFRQGDSASIRKQGGLGLGLAIVRELVALHEGTVRVQSPGEGQGATFTVRLPLITAHEDQTNPNPEDAASEPASDLTGIKILVVEDNEDSRLLLTFLLEEENAIVTAVASASEALSALSESLPDLLIGDISMPDVDGYTLIRQIRELPPEQGGQILAIAMTAYAEESDRAAAISAGFQRHIAKPVDLDNLIKVIFSLVREGI